VGEKALASDVSLMSELDDLHNPHGCLQEAQELAAKLYGADATFFAPNGTTGAIHAMLLGTLAPGDKILVPRNAHRSVIGGLILGGLRPVYVLPAYSEEWSLSLQVTVDDIEKMLATQTDIAAVLVTSPNYYGMVADLTAIAKVVHEHGALLLVDEAHGAHLGFSSAVPPSALQCGADVVAQSTHKLLGALTQCSMLHIKGARLDRQQVAAAMSLLTTTSPNYLLLASLDCARSQMATEGKILVERAVRVAGKLRIALEKIPQLKVLEQSIIGQGGVAGLDATKVTVNVRELGVTGVYVGEELRRAGIAVELVDRDNVLFLLTYADDNQEIDDIIGKIVLTFMTLGASHRRVIETEKGALPLPRQVLLPRVAFYALKKKCLFAQAVGEICAEQISFYPPGIPVVVPGEEITEEIIAYCQELKSAGIPVSGPQDSSLERIQVVKK
jgi:arginine/lysine/ornithine decarboxylase